MVKSGGPKSSGSPVGLLFLLRVGYRSWPIHFSFHWGSCWGKHYRTGDQRQPAPGKVLIGGG